MMSHPLPPTHLPHQKLPVTPTMMSHPLPPMHLPHQKLPVTPKMMSHPLPPMHLLHQKLPVTPTMMSHPLPPTHLPHQKLPVTPKMMSHLLPLTHHHLPPPPPPTKSLHSSKQPTPTSLRSPSVKMRVIALIMCSLALAAASTFSSWELFKAQYDRHYLDVEEEHYRQTVFEKNQEFINDFNKRFERGEVTFNLKMNQFGDMTSEEFNAMKGYRIKPRHSFMAAPRIEENEKAAEVDWREKGAVTPVVDQGLIGESWTYSATGSLEGQHFLKIGNLVKLSEQQLLDCMDGYFPGVIGAFSYVQENGGINTDAIYPSGISDGTCHYKPDITDATCSGSVIIETGSESALEAAVRDIGPISVGIDASHMSFQFYSSGVYYEPTCSPSLMDHAMLTVGYGTESGENYWIVKNSWGTSWGENGYIKMARNMDNNCGIASNAAYPLP